MSLFLIRTTPIISSAFTGFRFLRPLVLPRATRSFFPPVRRVRPSAGKVFCRLFCTRGGNKFFRDFGITGGAFYDARNSPDLISQIDDLIEEMADQPLYAGLIKAGAAQKGHVSDADLNELLQNLKDLKQAQQATWGKSGIEPFRNLVNFFRDYLANCQGKSTCPGDGNLLPACWWDTDATGAFVSPPAAGAIDGLFVAVRDLLKISQPFLNWDLSAVNCWYNPATYLWDAGNCHDKRMQTLQPLIFLGDLIDPTTRAVPLRKIADFQGALGNSWNLWQDQTFCIGDTPAQNRCCQYHQGRLAFDVSTFFFGIGEVNAGLKGFKLSSTLAGSLGKLSNLVGNIQLGRRLFSIAPLRKAGRIAGLGLGLTGALAAADPLIFIEKAGTEISMVFRIGEEATGAVLDDALEVFSRGYDDLYNNTADVLAFDVFKSLEGGVETKLEGALNFTFVHQTAAGNLVFSRQQQGQILVPFAVMTMAGGALLKINSQPVPGCEVCQYHSEAVCKLLTGLRTKAISQGMTASDADKAFSKLCLNVPGEPTLLAIGQKLNEFDPIDLKAVLSDISCLTSMSSSYSFCRKPSDVRDYLLDSWQIMKAQTERRQYLPLLQELKTLREKTTVWEKLGKAEGVALLLAANVRAPYKECTRCSAPYLRDVDEYLTDVSFFAENYANVPGYNTAMTMLGSKAYWNQVEPEAFVLRVLHSTNEQGVAQLEANSGYPGFRPDVVLTDGTLCEYKSWAGYTADYINNGYAVSVGSDNDEDDETPEGGYGNGPLFGCFARFLEGKSTSYQQFKRYLGFTELTDLAGLRYYFDGRKLAGSSDSEKTVWVKKQFRDMMYYSGSDELTPRGEEIFEVLWGNNNGLRQSLFKNAPKSSAYSMFKTTLVANLNSTFYSFIIVK